VCYDIYRQYINPNATGKQILMWSRVGVTFWAIMMAIASIVLDQIGIGLGWVYNFMAIALGAAVVPIACSIYTDKLDGCFAVASALIGQASAITVWLITASTYGPVDKNTTGMLYAQLAGGTTALGASFIVCCIGCVVKPMNFDWQIMYDGIKLVPGDGGEDSKVLGEDDPEATPEALLKAKAWIFNYGWGYTVFLCIAWPLMCVPMGAFGKSTFQLWAAVALMWGWIAGLVIIFLPLYESSSGLMAILNCKKSSDTKVNAKSTAVASTSSSTTAA